MPNDFVSTRDLEFLLYEVLDCEALLSYPHFAEHDRETFALVLDAALRLARERARPFLAAMDRTPPRFENGRIRVHSAVRPLMQACGDGGWIGAQASHEQGGQQLPNAIMSGFRFILAASNYSAMVYPFLTAGAAHLILSFGSKELIDRYVPPMFAGRWQGTMALTEPHAGSSLADITTLARPREDGTYRMEGRKIFISCADHDGVDNVVNLLLARIEGAPPGSKGISLFVVPQRRLEADGALVDNDVVCAGMFHKLGYRGAPITQLNLGERGDCHGWLLGQAHHGLKYMFQMMNEARIEVGLGATAIATAAYHAALDYARERPQGRRIRDRDVSRPQVPIIEHADVRRMLLFQRAIVEGSLALVLQCAKYVDLAAVLEGEPKKRVVALLDLLTPVAKTFPSELGILSVSQGLQCLGGYGYCEDFPLEQYYRDVRIHTLHEGTTGIQALDLLARKVVADGGYPFFVYLEELRRAIDAAKGTEALVWHAERLEKGVATLEQVTTHLTGFALRGEFELFLADATLYLELFGFVSVGWQWLLQAQAAQRALAHATIPAERAFYEGKLLTARYFFSYELPKVEGLRARLLEGDGLTLKMSSELFDG